MAYIQPNKNASKSGIKQTHNMTPNASEKESKAVRDKFDKTYMKKEVVDKQPMFVSTELISNKKGKELISNKKEMKDFKLNTQERRDEYTRRNWKQDETTTVKPVTKKAGSDMGIGETILRLSNPITSPSALPGLKAFGKNVVMPKIKKIASSFSTAMDKLNKVKGTGGPGYGPKNKKTN